MTTIKSIFDAGWNSLEMIEHFTDGSLEEALKVSAAVNSPSVTRLRCHRHRRRPASSLLDLAGRRGEEEGVRGVEGPLCKEKWISRGVSEKFLPTVLFLQRIWTA
uniref:Uncharacterized protein n=1 Tax=Setaria viridis TaxID=4556 RepID=A0A4U6W5R1_SETVI|nr:hypothetical protein SEVIR_1G080700v2 [Setaria viridis]